METINLKAHIKEYHKRSCIEAIEKTIEYARHLNEFGGEDKTMHILHGTEFLRIMLRDKVISNSLYKQLVRLAEDPKMEYKIIVK